MDANPIDNAVLWFHRNYEQILDALPFTIGCCTYLPAWPERLTDWVIAWEEDRLSESLARVYLLNPLREIRDYLRDRK